MLELANLAYISLILGKDTKVKTPLALKCALVTGGSKLFNAH